MRQSVAQHPLDEGEDGGRIDLGVVLVMVVRLDRQRVVAEAEAEVGLAECGAQDGDLWF
jgi:hypothetical protein